MFERLYTNPQIKREIEKLERRNDIKSINLFADNSDDIVTVDLYLTLVNKYGDEVEEDIRVINYEDIHYALYMGDNELNETAHELNQKLKVVSDTALEEAEKIYKYLSKYYQVGFNHIMNHV